MKQKIFCLVIKGTKEKENKMNTLKYLSLYLIYITVALANCELEGLYESSYSKDHGYISNTYSYYSSRKACFAEIEALAKEACYNFSVVDLPISLKNQLTDWSLSKSTCELTDKVSWHDGFSWHCTTTYAGEYQFKPTHYTNRTCRQLRICHNNGDDSAFDRAVGLGCDMELFDY